MPKKFLQKRRFSLRYTIFIGGALVLFALFASLFQSLSPTHAAPATLPSIVFVHGFSFAATTKGSSQGVDCNQYWGDARTFIAGQSAKVYTRTVQYYTGDTNCNDNGFDALSANLHDPQYEPACENFPTGFAPSTEGTNNESLYHISCLFAWYLYYNFGQQGQNVEIVAHSMGGLIVRAALYEVQTHNQAFPSTVGHVTGVITANTPHAGFSSTQPLISGIVLPHVCDGCGQVNDMLSSSQFMQDLIDNAQDPQPGGGNTDWTVMGSVCDQYVDAASAVSMTGANHKVIYNVRLNGNYNACYDHGYMIHDSNPHDTASQAYCDTTDPIKNPCIYNPNVALPQGWGLRILHRGLTEIYQRILSANP